MIKNRIADLLKQKVDSYEDAKMHSEIIDKLLNFRCEEVEAKLQLSRDEHSKKYWIGLDSQAFQTPYHEIAEMIKTINPQPGQTWIDLGAAYGRVGIVLSILSGQTKFVGYEIVPDRFAEARRIFLELGIDPNSLKMENLVDPSVSLPWADLYFIYDFSDRESVLSVLKKLQANAKLASIKVIARGRGAKNWIYSDCPWLCEVHQPVQYATWTLFQS